MRQLSESEASSLQRFVRKDQPHALIHVSATGLRKSVLDAVQSLRDLLRIENVHDYMVQEQGPKHKVIQTWIQAFDDGTRQERNVSLYRPSSGNGDPRFWIANLAKFCPPDSVLAFAVIGTHFSFQILGQPSSTNEDLQLDPGVSHAQDVTIPNEPHPLQELLDQLWAHSTGGSSVAARPATVEVPRWWPKAERAAGVSAAQAWFRADRAPSNDSLKFLFLVGGPGGGKSFAASELIADMEELNEKSVHRAHRRHEYSSLERKVILINDASITESSGEESLANDMQTASQMDADFIACVNRGILIEECRILGGENEFSPLVAWLAGQSIDSKLEIEKFVDLDYLKSVRCQLGGRQIEIVCVFVDTCSLLELAPVISSDDLFHGADMEPAAAQYRIQTWAERQKGEGKLSPAHELFSLTAEMFESAEFAGEANVNPFKANVVNATNLEVQWSVLAILRAGEIASGLRFTYREMWGAIARIFVGEATKSPLSDFENVLPSIPVDPVGRIEALLSRANFRFHMGLLGPFQNDERSRTLRAVDPVLRIVHLVDPLLDARPGRRTSGDPWGWATPIADAFSGPLNEFGPLSLLEADLGEDDGIHSALTDFDRELDSSFVVAMRQDSLAPRTREDLIRRYSMYVHRLYAVSNGIPAFQEQVSMWLSLWRMSPQFSSNDVEQKFLTLIRPPRNPDEPGSSSLLPLLDSRSTPITGSVNEPKLALRTNDIRARTSRNGEDLFLVLSEHNRDFPSLPIDFALIREMDVHLPSHRGVTELSRRVAPRLERVRSASLTPNALSGTTSYRVITRDAEVPMGLEA
jgi:hypothetical protein